MEAIEQKILKLLFDWQSFTKDSLIEYCTVLPNKTLRWLATNHPDNRTRKCFFRMTNVEIGSGSVINQGFVVSDDYEPLLTIGKRVAISPNVTVICASKPNNSLLQLDKTFNEKYIKKMPVKILNDSWIGAGAIILPGITIGKASIVGAGSVVTRDVPPASVVSGVPAKVLKALKI